MSKLLDGEYDVEKTLCLRTEDGEEQSLDTGVASHHAFVCLYGLRRENFSLGDDRRMSWKKTIHGLVKPDWVFAIMLVASGAFFFTSQSDIDVGGGVTVSPMIKGILVFGSVVLVSFLSTMGISLDRKLADDYYFQLMAHGAIVGIITNLMIVGAFVLFKEWLPALSIKDIFSVMMAAWALGYFFYRWRGLNT